MNYLKSKTNQGIVLLLLQSVPALNDQVWEVFARAGIPDPAIAWLQILALLGAGVYALYGRKVAKGPL